MAQKYTRAVGSVRSNGAGGWDIDVDLTPVREEKVAFGVAEPEPEPREHVVVVTTKNVWGQQDIAQWASILREDGMVKRVEVYANIEDLTHSLQMEAEEKADAALDAAAPTESHPHKPLFYREETRSWEAGPIKPGDGLYMGAMKKPPLGSDDARRWVAGREREYADAKRKHDLRLKKLELENEKLEAEIADKQADLLFSAACTRMKIAEARRLEAQALLDEAVVGINQEHFPRAVHEIRISAANVRIAEARASIEERNNRHQGEDESRRRNNANLAEKLAATT